MLESLLFKKIYGSIVGCAIGDAMGSAVETMHYKDIEEKAGKVTGFIRQFDRHPDLAPENRLYYETLSTAAGPAYRGRTRPYGPFKDMAGAYTDDTRIQLLYYQTIVRKGGRITGRDLARELLEYRLTYLGVSKNPTFQWNGGELERIMIETHGWFDPFDAYTRTRFPQIGIDAPAGVINPFDPGRASEEGYVVAASVAEAMKSDSTVDSIIKAALASADCLGRESREFRARVLGLLEIAEGCKDVFEIREPFYERFLAKSSGYWMESIPCVLVMLYIARGDPVQTIIGAVNFGRDCDTIAAIAGQLVGAFKGIDGFPKNWVRQIIEANPEVDMYKLAEEVCEVVVRILRQREQVSDYLRKIM